MHIVKNDALSFNGQSQRNVTEAMLNNGREISECATNCSQSNARLSEIDARYDDLMLSSNPNEAFVFIQFESNELLCLFIAVNSSVEPNFID